ncbi:MAG TPA: SDR family NAD(P)-dependent oxidoreductase [Ignavibacteriaceae bacterium]|nr:SDR family NAD(P)-dependent oxidoreductase [Ignavibacteriaceae bacterium]
MEFKNKNILLTGASSGIGYELAKSLAAEKCNLALIARRVELLDKLKDELKDSGSNIITIKCDVSKKEEVREAYKIFKQNFGIPDIAILNSGISIRSSIDAFDVRNAEVTMGVNFFGIVYFVGEMLDDFMERKSGYIVGVSSLAESKGYPKSGFYSASKAAASIYLESLSVELEPFHIKVITIKPGFVKTPMTDKNKFKMLFLMPVDKAIKIIIKGLRADKRIIQFPLATSIASKLLRFLPYSIFKRVSRVQK